MCRKINQVACLETPRVPVVSGAKSFANHATYMLGPACAQRALDRTTTTGASVRELMQSWQADPVLNLQTERLPDHGPDVVLVQPTVIALLAARGLIDQGILRLGARFAVAEYTRNIVAEVHRLASEASKPGWGRDANEEHAEAQQQLAKAPLDRSMYLRTADLLRSLHSEAPGNGDDERAKLRLVVGGDA